MPALPRKPRIYAAVAWAVITLCFALSAEAASPKRVLIIYSFGRDIAPYDAIASVFRTEVARMSTDPIVFAEASLDAGRTVSAAEERAFLDYLVARFASGAPDVVVTIGPQAARFYLAHRNQLFAETPLVVAALDERLARGAALRPHDAAVAGKLDFPLLVEHMLRILPDTQTIAVVVGASDAERFWLAELQKDLAPFKNRVNFLWLNDLSLDQIKERVASLPPHSAIFYNLFVVDAAGVPQERQNALESLHAVANAPIFGLYEIELGRGVVGGPYSSQTRRGKQIAAAVNRIIYGPMSNEPQIQTTGFESPVYDWRELTRWNIDPERLPAGSEVRFKQPSLWDEHRSAVVAAIAALVLQAALIVALLLQRAHRRRAEQEAAGLAGRLVTAHEDERRRLARELHDDVTQRLAGLAIEAAGLESGATHEVNADAAHSIRQGLVELSDDVHALSYRLHPSVIEDLGLVDALQIECDRIANQGALRVNFDCQNVPRKLPADAALCLFRVAQEALRNVERHSGAANVDVSVVGKDEGIALAVRDNGAGFEPMRAGERASLGLASMRERVRLLGGRLTIESGRGRGTALFAWVPLREAT